MFLKDFSKLNRERCESEKGFNHKIDSWGLNDWMVALTGEVGEACNIAKKILRLKQSITTTDLRDIQQLYIDLVKELADIDIYLDLVYQFLGIERVHAIIDKFNETSRKINYNATLIQPTNSTHITVQNKIGG